MKPLIFEYAEKPKSIDLDNSLVEYCESQNLTIVKGTHKPAITNSLLETETFTKTAGESSDSDNNFGNKLKSLTATETKTFTSTEASDSDRDRLSIRELMDTQSITESVEPTDSDR